MKPIFKVKIAIDTAMTAALLLLMAYGLIGETAHEWIGIAMFVLFIAHHILNRRWFFSLFKGRYTPQRILITVISVLILVFMLGSMISGIIISRHIFTFSSGGTDESAVTIHTLCAYWGFVLMSLHLGEHWNMILSAVGKHLKPSVSRKRTTRIIGYLIAIYGIYAFVRRNIGVYLLLKSHFVFFDYTEPVIFFLADYLAVIGLFVLIGYYLFRFIGYVQNRRKLSKR